ncbi:TPA: hypothetical protein ACKRTJ_002188 [Proteus mirabilis]|uniref:hypothetical protein n=1 Tax=Proteus mirabilis TaxID=584 RepID=UPI0005364EBC|nr:hypothetical protein [Proteus mirabilis]AUU38431.1 hypothetical protein MC73_005405 [Proteus mirabilis]EKV7292922.1 hypothetical protein [Proteus mirabilis]EKV7658368.1 hypothetical protein [Proteus mirabilis]EKX9512463.1 hypothetical protein [Proteus mirabilis]ELB3498160.1 hypothetical protein [Proteus mirabilis]
MNHSIKLTSFNKNHKVIDIGDHLCRVPNNRINPIVLIKLIAFKGIKKAVYGMVIVVALSCGQVRAQGSEVITSDARHVSFPVFTIVEEFIKKQEQRICNGIEFLSFVSSASEGMTKPSSQEKGKNSPKESNKTEAGFEKRDQVTQEDIEHVKSSLIGMLFASLVMIPLGIMFSECISPRILAKRKRWMKLHELKAKRFYRNNPGKYYVMPRKTFCQWLWF